MGLLASILRDAASHCLCWFRSFCWLYHYARAFPRYIIKPHLLIKKKTEKADGKIKEVWFNYWELQTAAAFRSWLYGCRFYLAHLNEEESMRGTARRSLYITRHDKWLYIRAMAESPRVIYIYFISVFSSIRRRSLVVSRGTRQGEKLRRSGDINVTKRYSVRYREDDWVGIVFWFFFSRSGVFFFYSLFLVSSFECVKICQVLKKCM